MKTMNGINVYIGKTSEVGGCYGCNGKPELVYVVELLLHTIYLCDSCWNSLYGALNGARLRYSAVAVYDSDISRRMKPMPSATVTTLNNRPSMNVPYKSDEGETIVIGGQEAIYCIKCKQFIDMCKCPERKGMKVISVSGKVLKGPGYPNDRIACFEGVAQPYEDMAIRDERSSDVTWAVIPCPDCRKFTVNCLCFKPGKRRWEHLKQFSTPFLLRAFRRCIFKWDNERLTAIVDQEEYTREELQEYLATRPHVSNKKESRESAMERKKSGVRRSLCRKCRHKGSVRCKTCRKR